MPKLVARRTSAGGGRRHPFIVRLCEAISAHQLLASGSRAVVGVSGGADSVALLHALAALAPQRRWRLLAVHVDHQLRDGSGEDARFVQQLAERLGVPSAVERRDVTAACRAGGWSLEDGARRLRHEALRDAARRFSASAIALAHTADDQAETVLLRLLRGTGLTGLAAMAPKRVWGDVAVIRPLLGISRGEVVAYLESAGMRWREDPSNTDRRFARNKVRHELLPALEAFNPSICDALRQLADQSRADSDFLDAQAKRHRSRVLKPSGPGRVRVRLSVLRRLAPALQRQLIRDAVELAQGDLTGFEFRHWRQIERLLAPQARGTAHLPDGLRLTRAGDDLLCELPPQGILTRP